MTLERALSVIDKRVPTEEMQLRMATALMILHNTHRGELGYDDVHVMDACRQLDGSSPAGGKR